VKHDARAARNAQNGQKKNVSAVSAASASIVVLVMISCGKSGPPLPPLVRLPVAPANVSADRRGVTVDLRFTVPSVNTDNSRPANIERVEVYAITAPATVTDEQLLKRGTLIASIDVKAPVDPDKAADEDEPLEDADPAVGTGLDQGVDAHAAETLTADALAPADLSRDGRRARKPPLDENRPLTGPPSTVPARVYALVGVARNGKRGPWSRRLLVPLVPPPPAPAPPKIAYDEKSISVTWEPVQRAAASPEGVLPSKALGATPIAITYNVYDVSPGDAGASAGSGAAGTKLTPAALADTKFVDTRMAWGAQRCYAVRAVESVAGLTIESDAADGECVTLTDTFPPAVPANLKSVGSEGVINLIWDANGEQDLAGYLIFRGTGAGELTQITPALLQEPHFEDTVRPGIRYVYAVKAVDKSGNISDFSNRQEETAR
jgi:hypothetical protein